MSPTVNLCLALEGVRSGENAALLAPAWLWVYRGTVAHLAGHPPPALPPDTPVLRGGWAIEPLADAHVHLFLDGAREATTRARTAALPPAAALERILGLLENYRSRGIAAVRDGGDPHGLALAAARHANRSPDRYAAVLPAGEPVFRRGLYGGFLGQGIAAVSEVAALLRRNQEAGATHAKVLATGLNSLDQAGAVGPAQFSRAELRTIAAAAKDLQLPLMVHANGPLADVLAAGPGSVEHGFGCTARDRGELAAQGILWAPTLGAWAELADHPGLSAEQLRVVRETDRRHRQEVQDGHDRGVPIAAGSDAGSPGVPHGTGLLRELRHLAAAGLTSQEALAAATHTARVLCQAEAGRPLGGLTPDRPAGFLWLGQDPAVHPEALEQPRGVFLGGVWTPAGERQTLVNSERAPQRRGHPGSRASPLLQHVRQEPPAPPRSG